MANGNPYANLSGLLGQAYQDPMQGAIGGASRAIAPMMGYTDRPTSMGQMLAAAGGGAVQGRQGAMQQNIGLADVQMKMEQAKIAQQAALQQQQAMTGMAQKLGLPPGTPQEVILETMKQQTAAGKFGSPTVVADEESPTGYSSVQIAQDGTQRVIGPAKPPTSMYDPKGAEKKVQFEGALGKYNEATTQVNEADIITANVSQMMSLVDRVDSGSFAQTRNEMKKMLNAVGADFDPNDIADVEAMKSKGMDFVLQLISKTKGAISQKEMDAFAAASAGLKNTPAGNRMILGLAQKIADRNRYEANAVRAEYGSNPKATIKELDDIRFKARKEFGSVVPERQDSNLAITTPPGTIGAPTGGFKVLSIR